MANNRKRIVFITQGALIAACYVVLTYLSLSAGLASGVIQCRVSEALCVLAAYTPAAIPGLAVGCLLANLLTNAVLWDVIFGSLATLVAACVTYMLRKYKYIAAIPPIITNTAVIPPVLIYCYGATEGYLFVTLTVFIGEVISCGVLGTSLVCALEKTKTGKNIADIIKNGHI